MLSRSVWAQSGLRPMLSLVQGYLTVALWFFFGFLLAGSSCPYSLAVSYTHLEGMNVREVAQLLEENGVCSAEDVLEVANSDELDGFDPVSYTHLV